MSNALSTTYEIDLTRIKKPDIHQLISLYGDTTKVRGLWSPIDGLKPALEVPFACTSDRDISRKDFNALNVEENAILFFAFKTYRCNASAYDCAKLAETDDSVTLRLTYRDDAFSPFQRIGGLRKLDLNTDYARRSVGGKMMEKYNWWDERRKLYLASRTPTQV